MANHSNDEGKFDTSSRPVPDTFRYMIMLFVKGIAMGAAEVVPGVSGGTIAFITGIYERLLAAINRVSPALVRILLSDGLTAAWRYLDGNFLLILLLGMALSIFSLASLISHLLSDYPVLIWSFFFGLIIASIALVTRTIRVWRKSGWVALLLGATLGSVIVQLVPVQIEPLPMYLFFGGALAVCAWILPGLSGSFILLVLGLYASVLEAVSQTDFALLGILAAGCVLGLLAFARVLTWMFAHHHDQTLGLLCGFMAGSLGKVWPWKYTLSYQMTPDGRQIPLVQEAVFPATYLELTGLDPQILAATGAALFGLVLVLALDRLNLEP